MNASLEGWIARTAAGGADVSGLPPSIRLASLAAGVAIVMLTIARTRDVDVERSWPLLVTTALLVSPLGWIYYFWWIFPGIRPWRVLLVAPLLWVPWAYLAVNPANRLVAATLGSLYFWGAAALWIYEMQRLSVANHPQQAAV
jgi:hypothetical protein